MSVDYNPDKERHVKRKFLVQPSSKRPEMESVKTGDGRELRFDKFKRFSIADEGMARELQTEYGNEIVVSRMRQPEHGHNYYFGQMPDLPYAKYDELGRRIGNKKERN